MRLFNDDLVLSDHVIQQFLGFVTYAVDGTSKPKITHFYATVLIYQDVRRLQVPVQHFAIVQVLNRVQQIPQNCFNVN